MKIVLIVFLIFIVLALIFIANNENKKYNILRTIFCFLCAGGFLYISISFDAPLFNIGTVFFVICGIFCARNLNDDI